MRSEPREAYAPSTSMASGARRAGACRRQSRLHSPTLVLRRLSAETITLIARRMPRRQQRQPLRAACADEEHREEGKRRPSTVRWHACAYEQLAEEHAAGPQKPGPRPRQRRGAESKAAEWGDRHQREQEGFQDARRPQQRLKAKRERRRHATRRLGLSAQICRHRNRSLSGALPRTCYLVRAAYVLLSSYRVPHGPRDPSAGPGAPGWPNGSGPAPGFGRGGEAD